MNRRQYLQRVTAGMSVGVVGTTGCTALTGDSTEDQHPNLTLSKPEDLRADPAKLPYPAWGQQIPEVTLPAPLQDVEVTTTQFDTPLVLTFIYTNCQTACPLLTQALVRTQAAAAADGYSDGVTFAEITFDPERDTPDTLRQYAEERNVDLSAKNWYFLRPPTVERATDVVNGEFGIGFERTTPEDMDEYMFMHSSLILLVNSDNYVERTYRGGQKAMGQLTDDVQTLRTK